MASEQNSKRNSTIKWMNAIQQDPTNPFSLRQPNTTNQSPNAPAPAPLPLIKSNATTGPGLPGYVPEEPQQGGRRRRRTHKKAKRSGKKSRRHHKKSRRHHK
jgi:hypothetical protein